MIAAAVVAAIVLVVVLLLTSGGGGSKPRPTAVTRSAPVAASEAQLRALPATLGHPVYWVGPRPGNTYELTRFSDGGAWIRYLPSGVSVGAPNQTYVTVGSYPVADAYAAAQRGARRPGATTASAAKGGLLVIPPEHPQSVYVAYPGAKVLIEVYSPSPARSRKLASSTALVPLP
ncbi:MAG: hypothetical protein E6G56_13005 [Actinobacteria bacterium]|nr:MAG: hypothetical protein E6G56_13005 [Actinomycetota bacterium]